MRILFTFAGGTGHLVPLLPIARALLARGHDITFSGQRSMLPIVEAAGYVGLDSGGPTLAATEFRGPLRPVDRRREENVIRDVFAGAVASERAARLIAVARAWSADVIVRDEVDFGAVVAAEVIGIPHAGVIVLAAGGLIRSDLVAQRLDALRALHGLEPDPGLLALHQHLTLAPVPPSFRSPTDPLPATARHLRPAVLDEAPAETDGERALVEWLARDPRPTVYFTLGTVFPQEAGDLFTRVLAGLSKLDAKIVTTVGGDVDPAELGKQPANVRVELFVPQQLLLPHCDLVVSQGGSGTVIGALAFGVPLLILPMGADQPLNADRAAALGVATVLDPVTSSSARIQRTAGHMLTAAQHRRAAQRVAQEIAALPPAYEIVPMVEGLVAR